LPFVPAPHRFLRGRCAVCGAPESLEREGRENYAYSFIHDAYPTKEMKDMKFDIIVTNPPFRKMSVCCGSFCCCGTTRRLSLEVVLGAAA
ncbi:MAG: hypothetical protein QG597_4385, partial [Actinomycetota bacterium]|nr:hypothetical protein [Actinomycetota bacterium]